MTELSIPSKYRLHVPNQLGDTHSAENFRAIDRWAATLPINLLVTTSDKRPPAIDGTTIFETDTSRLCICVGGDWIQLNPDADNVDTLETTTSTAYTDLTTSGPAVTLLTGSRVLVTVSARLYCDTAGGYVHCSAAVSGATTAAAQVQNALLHGSPTANETAFTSRTTVISGLTPGLNTFTMKYATSTGVGNFGFRYISVQPLLT